MRFSALRIFKEGLTGNMTWEPHWRNPSPKSKYDVIIIGGGGHGLSTAYYLAKNHGIRNVAVLEKGHLGSGNIGRNTTIVRANYLLPGNSEFYSHSLKLWEGLEADLNYNVMMSQRGLVMLCHSDGQRDAFVRRANAMRSRGDDAQMLSVQDLRKFLPYLNYNSARFPIYGGLLQKRAGTARHDAVAWGYARAADDLGVDIIQKCEVTGLRRQGRKIVGVETSHGFIKTKKVGCVVAGHSSVVAAMAGIRLPIASRPLQALVSEPIKPILDTVIMSNAVHMYISQSDKGEMVLGAGVDKYNSYAQRGSFPVPEHMLAAAVELFPVLSRLRMLRHWGGIVDTCPDASPIISKTDIDGLYFDCGWGTGGFKATPGSGHVFADLIANDRPNKIAAPYTLDRFRSGLLIDEHGAAGVAH